MIKRSSVGLTLVAILAVGAMPVAAQSPTAPAPVTIRFGTYDLPFVAAVNQMLVDDFKKLHPGSDVKVEYMPSDSAAYNAALATQAAAGTLPDVLFTADLFVKPFASAGIVTDMEPLAKADSSFDLNDIYPNLLGLSQVDGKGLYMIPSSYDVVTMFYNKDMFTAAGAPLPAANWTWDDYIAACKTIRAKTGNYCLSGRDNNDASWWWAYFVPWITGHGGKLLSDDGKTVLLDSPEALAGLQAYVDMWTVDDIAQPLDFAAGGECFTVGKCATVLDIPGKMSGLRTAKVPFDWDVQVIPSQPNGKVTGMGTYGFAVSADTKDPAAAWDFVKGLVSPETQKTIAANYAGVPLLKSLANDPTFANLAAPPATVKAFIDNGPNGITPPSFPGDCGSLYAGQIAKEIKDALQASILKTSSVTDAFTTATQNIQACIDKG